MRISDWSSDVCSSDLCKARNGVERAAQFVDELADRIAGAAGILGRASIGCFVGLRAAGAAAIAAELPRRRLEPGQGRKAPFPGVSGRAFQDHPRVDDFGALAKTAGGDAVDARFATERRLGDRQPDDRAARDAVGPAYEAVGTGLEQEGIVRRAAGG